MRNLFAQDQGAGVAARKVQSAGFFVLAAQLFDGTARYGQFFLTGGAFHGEEIAAHLYQRKTVFGQHGQRSHSPGRCQIKLFTPRLAGGFLGALLCKLHAGQAQLGTGVLQKLHPLTGGLHQGQLQFRLVDFGHDAREACACAHIHHAARHFRLAGKQQAVEEVLILDPLGVGDSGQVDLLVVVHQDFGKGIQLVQLGAGESDVPCGTFCFKARFIDHTQVFLSVIRRSSERRSARGARQAGKFPAHLPCAA